MRTLTVVNALVFWLSIALVIKYDSLMLILVFIGFLFLEIIGLFVYGHFMDKDADIAPTPPNKKPRS